jgi:hypothetical protein
LEFAGTFFGAGATAIFAAVISISNSASEPVPAGMEATASLCIAMECGARRILCRSGWGSAFRANRERPTHNTGLAKMEDPNRQTFELARFISNRVRKNHEIGAVNRLLRQ